MLVSVTSQDATKFVSERHYTRSASPGVLRYGWEVSGKLVGVSIYDTGNHAMRQGVFGPEHYTHVLHHHRLALEPGMPKGTASEFLGACMREIRVARPDVWAIVTYADACQLHAGTIYQATNAIYTGVMAKGNLKFVDVLDDWQIHPTQSLKGTWPERRKQAWDKGWYEIRCEGKHRYVYLLGTRQQRRFRPSMLWPVLDYPKKPLDSSQPTP